MAIEYERRKRGGSPQRFATMTIDQLRDFAKTPRKGLPQRAASGVKKRRLKIAAIRGGY